MDSDEICFQRLFSFHNDWHHPIIKKCYNMHTCQNLVQTILSQSCLIMQYWLCLALKDIFWWWSPVTWELAVDDHGLHYQYTFLSFNLVPDIMGVKKRTTLLKVKQEEISGHEKCTSKPLHINILWTLQSPPFTC
jgi:hypothetical protein